MDRITAFAAVHAAVPSRRPIDGGIPRIGLVEVPGLTALVVSWRYASGPWIDGYVDFICVDAGCRLRCGTLRILIDSPLPSTTGYRRLSHACRPPANQEDLAREIGLAIDLMDFGAGVTNYNGKPFRLLGWSPMGREGALRGKAENVPIGALPGVEWLEGEPVSDEACNRLWDQGIAPFATPADLEAMSLFDVQGDLDFAAFDACRETGERGAARRAFAKANPLLANVALGDPGVLAMVDGRARLVEILDALSDGHAVNLLPPRALGGTTASKAALLALSGRRVIMDRGTYSHPNTLSAAEQLPREWLATTQDEALAFTAICGLARRTYAGPSQGIPEGIWRQAMAGSGGRWVAYARRIDGARDHGAGRNASSPEDLADRIDRMGSEGAPALDHFVRDILAPACLTYGDGTAMGLAGRMMRGLSPVKGEDALRRFARDAFLSGMALPAWADALRRRHEARSAIRSVVAAHPPRVGEGAATEAPGRGSDCGKIDAAIARARSWPEMAWMEVEGAPEPALGESRRMAMRARAKRADYDFEAPGALDAMLDAWRRVLPRRWRRLDARGLAAAFDAEAKAFAEVADLAGPKGIDRREPTLVQAR